MKGYNINLISRPRHYHKNEVFLYTVCTHSYSEKINTYKSFNPSTFLQQYIALKEFRFPLCTLSF